MARYKSHTDNYFSSVLHDCCRFYLACFTSFDISLAAINKKTLEFCGHHQSLVKNFSEFFIKIYSNITPFSSQKNRVHLVAFAGYDPALTRKRCAAPRLRLKALICLHHRATIIKNIPAFVEKSSTFCRTGLPRRNKAKTRLTTEYSEKVRN